MLVAASLMASSSAIASATDSPVPLLKNYKACDFTQNDHVVARGYGRATAYVSTNSGNVVARVDMNTGVPDTHYDVRIIQTPRASIGCGPGAPGVALGSLTTDAAGAGSTTVQGPIAPGKTGAWVILERAAENSQTPAEFYTSEYIAKF